MLVIPAIDLKDGQCVRLRQGRMDDATVFSDDPVAMAAHWVAQGARRLHLVDLNGAFARAHPDLPIQIGGGIRSADTIEAYLGAGVCYVIIGTKAVKDPDFVTRVCRDFPDRIIVGIDARDGRVATEGWAEVTEVRAVDLARRFAADGVSAIVYTDIERDGMLGGVNLDATLAVAAAGIPVIASGGVTNLEDIRALRKVAGRGILGAITGRAIYEGTLDLAAAQALCDG
jgi:phosphoribosylformimino-5-aminoimidazole carboxamide ribotide isomerase